MFKIFNYVYGFLSHYLQSTIIQFVYKACSIAIGANRENQKTILTVDVKQRCSVAPGASRRKSELPVIGMLQKGGRYSRVLFRGGKKDIKSR